MAALLMLNSVLLFLASWPCQVAAKAALRQASGLALSFRVLGACCCILSGYTAFHAFSQLGDL